ncbi:hypothetical protein GOBAR_AA02149 [Gossypium barbadense]|uniref:S-acyltransferase n=1 Tax=Gossypium barbadense TaxID=3634 RepID=A0A2P5YS78_GOSBA|nr:hypothetical protein GOBAR_AA02149 [Gossypium barbadense]
MKVFKILDYLKFDNTFWDLEGGVNGFLDSMHLLQLLFSAVYFLSGVFILLLFDKRDQMLEEIASDAVRRARVFSPGGCHLRPLVVRVRPGMALPLWEPASQGALEPRPAISPVMDVLFNVEMIMLIIGLFRLFFFSIQSFATSIIWIMLKDPGFVVSESFSLGKLNDNSVLGVQTHNESSLLQMRARYCKSCQTYVQGFDHHCPAFGNCIGQKNYVLFMVLLVGFITAEISYIVCSSLFTSKFRVLEENRVESGSILVMARSTLLFCVLQVLWQGPFLIWHVYCICFNIRTEEWVNWKNYPEFQLNASSLSGHAFRSSSLVCDIFGAFQREMGEGELPAIAMVLPVIVNSHNSLLRSSLQ